MVYDTHTRRRTNSNSDSLIGSKHPLLKDANRAEHQAK